MSNPQRHDIFEDENGNRVAVCQVFPPNAMGVAYVEYKNLTDSNLRFSPQAEFLEQFQWVDNFGSTDTHAKVAALQAIEVLPDATEAKQDSPEGVQGSSSEALEESEGKKMEEDSGDKSARLG